MNLTFNNLEWLIYHKTKPNQTCFNGISTIVGYLMLKQSFQNSNGTIQPIAEGSKFS